MNDAGEIDDAELLRRARGGDRVAGDTFVGRHLAAVVRYARAVCPDPVAAEDVTQDVFVAAFTGSQPLAGASARAWLLVSTRHAAWRLHRRRVGEPAAFVPLESLGLAAGWGEDPETVVSRLEDRARLDAALQRLSVEDREVIVLRDLEGLDGEATAALIGVEVAAMKSRLHRARLRLMAALREGGVDADRT